MSGRLLAVLGCFEEAPPALTLTQVARRAGLPVSTARRLLAELTAWGALERRTDGRYCVGRRLWRIGALAPGRRDLREAAAPFLQDLYEAARENVQLVVPDGGEGLVVEKIYGAQAVHTDTGVGERMPLHSTGAGKAILAFAPSEFVADVVAAGLERCTPHTLVEPGRLAAALRRVRASGVAFSREEMTLGTVSVAAPVLDGAGSAVAAVAIVARAGTRLERLEPAVRAAALGISRAISLSAAADVTRSP